MGERIGPSPKVEGPKMTPRQRAFVDSVRGIPEVKLVSSQGLNFFTLIDSPSERDPNIAFEEGEKPRMQVYEAEATVYQAIKGNRGIPEFRLINVADFEDPNSLFEKYTGSGTKVLLDRRDPKPAA